MPKPTDEQVQATLEAWQRSTEAIAAFAHAMEEVVAALQVMFNAYRINLPEDEEKKP